MEPRYHTISSRAIRVPVPDVLQKTNFSCGPASLMAVARFYSCGPESEEEFIAEVRKAGMDSRVGSHPGQLQEVAHWLKLKTRVYQPMTVKQLCRCLRQKQPVLLMLQAWADERPDYRESWNHGHWVVAIGFDRAGVIFEDPMLEAVRGFLSFAELDARWHDTGPHGQRIDHFGLAVWKPGRNAAGYLKRVRHVE
jgi:predicted double-glycine peptidase